MTVEIKTPVIESEAESSPLAVLSRDPLAEGSRRAPLVLSLTISPPSPVKKGVAGILIRVRKRPHPAVAPGRAGERRLSRRSSRCPEWTSWGFSVTWQTSTPSPRQSCTGRPEEFGIFTSVSCEDVRSVSDHQRSEYCDLTERGQRPRGRRWRPALFYAT